MQPLIVIVGATGTGKSELSLAVARELQNRGGGAEIVNADAMQLYRGMDVGTAKVPLENRYGIRHHLLDVLHPTEESTVAAYQAGARAAIEEIAARGVVPILVGGSCLYVSSVIYDFRFPGTDPAVRARLEAESKGTGAESLFARLYELDSAAAESIGRSNIRRIVRALEVIEITGKPFGSGLPEGTMWRPATIIGLEARREDLVSRLDARVERMWQGGLVDEARELRTVGLSVTASRAIGYAQAIAYLDGELGREQAIERTAALTRRYARRQVGWFRRYHDATWFDYDAPDLAERALAQIAQASIRG